MKKFLPRQWKSMWDNAVDDIRRHSIWLRLLHHRMDKYKDKLK